MKIEKKVEKNRKISLRVSEDTFNKISALANQFDTTKTAVITTAIHQLIKRSKRYT